MSPQPNPKAIWTQAAEAYVLCEDTVELWRSDSMKGGIETLKVTAVPRPAPV